MNLSNQDCVIFPGRINPKEIAFVNAILDDHEGMVVCRTEDATEGRIEFWVSPGLVDEFILLINTLKNEMAIAIELYNPIPESTELIELKQNMNRGES